MNGVYSKEVADGLMARLVRSGFRRWFDWTGWKIDSPGPLPAKLLIVAAPHTSNWDFPYALAVGAQLRLKINFIGKISLFKWPFGGIMRWLGGISVDRNQRQDVVAQMVSAFVARREMQLVIAPEGTRDAVKQWKTGFYHIAVGAGVPLGLAYVDYARKIAGIGEVFYPTGDVEADIAHIRRFYNAVTPRHPEKTVAV